MHAVWNEIGMFNVTEERLVDQNNNILKRNLVSGLELEEIQRNTEMSEMVKWGWKARKMRYGSWDLIKENRMSL